MSRKAVVPVEELCILGSSDRGPPSSFQVGVETMSMDISRRRAVLGVLAACLLSCIPLSKAKATATAADKLRVLIIDGQNNHDWRMMTPPMKADLERSGRFTVDVVTAPDRKAAPSVWDSFRPDFKKYDVVLSNYN